MTEVLAENLRRQYLEAMGIQTWFDPSLPEQPVKAVSPVVEKLDIIAPDHQAQEKSKLAENENLLQEKTAAESSEKHLKTPLQEEPKHSIDNITSLTVAIEQCQLCELHTNRQQAICGEGDEQANLLVLIDAPLNDVVGENALFSSSDKKMLQAMLQAVGIELSSVYISSLVKCRPPEARAPFTSEMICCDDHLSAQIKLILPDVILVLGEQASQQLLVSQKSLTDLRLRRHQHLGVPVFASYHPHELFASSENKRKVWADLLQISKQLVIK